jgi:DNA-directed RNA polymerase I, II, and III subunit RPABC3
MASDSQLFLSTFHLDTSPDAVATQTKARYDRVTRYTALSPDNSVKLVFDVNTDLYTLSADTPFELLLASTLNLDGTKDESKSGGGWREKQPGESDLSDGWEYVCYGKVYKFEEGGDGEVM